MPKITISYRRADSEAMTGRIFDRLIAQYGRDAIFRDIDNIPAGIDFRQHINETLLKTGVLLAIVGPKWLGSSRGGVERINEESDPVRVEVETALRRRLPIVPVLIGNTRMPGSDQLPPSLKDFAFRNAVKIDTGRDFDHHMDQLFKSIDAILGEAATPSAPSRETKIPSVAAAPAARAETKVAAAVLDQPRKATGRTSSASTTAAIKAVLPSNKAGSLERPIVIREWDQIIWPKNTQGRRIRLVSAGGLAVALLAILATTLWPGGSEADSVHSLFVLQNSAPVSALAFSPDARMLAAASQDRSVHLWDVSAAKLSGKIPNAAGVSSVAFMPNGEQIVSGELNGVVLMTQMGVQPKPNPLPDVSYPWERAPAVQSIAVSPDGARVAAGYDEGTIKVWNVKGEASRPTKAQAHDGGVTAMAYLPDGGRLVSAAVDGTVRIWDPDGRLHASLAGHPGAIRALAVSRDGKWIAAGGSGATVVVWNAATGAVAHRLTTRFGDVESVAFSKGGERLALGGNDGSIEWWNVATGQRLGTVTGHVRNVHTIAFSPDGSRFASGGDSATIDMWSAN